MLSFLIKIEGTRLLTPHSAHNIWHLNVTHEDKCFRTVATYVFSYLQRVSGNSDRFAGWTFAIDATSINFNRTYASSSTIRPLYKEIILIIGVGGGSHVFWRTRSRRNALRELLQPRQLYLRTIRSVGYDDSWRLTDGT